MILHSAENLARQHSQIKPVGDNPRHWDLLPAPTESVDQEDLWNLNTGHCHRPQNITYNVRSPKPAVQIEKQREYCTGKVQEWEHTLTMVASHNKKICCRPVYNIYRAKNYKRNCHMKQDIASCQLIACLWFTDIIPHTYLNCWVAQQYRD